MFNDAHREVFGNVPLALEYLHYILSLAAVVILVYGVYRRFNLWRMGKIEGREGEYQPGLKGALQDISLLLDDKSIFKSYFLRVWRFFLDGILQRRPLRELYPGLMHICIFWGLGILLLGALVDASDHYLTFISPVLHFNQGIFYLGFSVFLEIISVLFVIGILVAIYRRYIQRPDRLDNKPEDALVLSLLLFIGISGFFLEAFGQLIDQPAWGKWSFAGFGIASIFKPLGSSPASWSGIYIITWFAHQFTALAFIAIIPYTRLLHILTSSMSLYLTSPGDEPKGALSTPFSLKEMMESEEEVDFKLGADRLEDFTFSQLVSLDACTRCGRCQDNCPAYLSERPLSPKDVIQDLKKHMEEKGKARQKGEAGKAIHEETIKAHTLWACTTCRNCIEQCPVGIEHIPLIVDLRRSLVGEAKIDQLQRQALMNTTNNYNPWGIAFADRAAWCADLSLPRAGAGDFEYLYFVGCAGSYDQRAQKIALAMVKILRSLGIKFAILGEQEKCCGEWVRRLGDEGLYQQLVMENVEVMNQAGVKKIITACPHCFTTLKDEYPVFGGNYEVYHQSQLLNQWIKSGQIRLQKDLALRIAYHDSCYLGRYHDIYQEPRNLIQAIPKTNLVEIERNRNRSFCCGAGGGGFWAEFEEGKNPNEIRLEQALKSNPEMIVTACPYCLTMFEDALKVKDLEEKIKTRDVTELIAEHLAEK